jgi:peptidase M28-like protein
MRARGVNLQAVRGRDDPRVWLVAHIDSKWQPVSMLTRVAGVVVAAIGIIGVAVCGFVAGFMEAAPVFAGITWLGGIPLMLSVVGSDNHGTLDNASGVAAVLAAAQQVPRDRAVGVMITDAEELALAGARAWAKAARPAIALNCDSVDDTGALTVMYGGAEPSRLVAAMRAAAGTTGEQLRIMRLIPGILTDSVALSHARWRSVTLSRGDLRTLQRIHTRGDTLAAMRGTGIPVAADVLARAASELSH